MVRKTDAVHAHEVHSTQVTKLTSPVHYLSEQQKLFVDRIIKGDGPTQAARIAGYACPDRQGYEIVKSKKVAAAVQYLYKKHEKVADISRRKVMDGFKEAIDMARIQADAGVMISGWREIAKLCGYYAPEIKKVDINITAKRVIDKLETLSDNDLLEMVEESQNVIEAEAYEVLNELQHESKE